MKQLIPGILAIVFIPVATFLIPYAAVGESGEQTAAAEGQRKAMPCLSCHGADGNTFQRQHPKLAGQNMEYLIIAMQAYRDGQRNSKVMSSFMVNLSDRDIEEIAAFYSSQQPR